MRGRHADRCADAEEYCECADSTDEPRVPNSGPGLFGVPFGPMGLRTTHVASSNAWDESLRSDH